MRCTKCGTESTTDRKFCAVCGSPLSSRCAKCGAENARASVFCEDCGSALAVNAPVEICVGINTGEVVMRSVGKDQSHAEYLPAGHAVGVASRLQTIAPTGLIALSEHRRRLVEGYFQLKSLGLTRIKGVTEAETGAEDGAEAHFRRAIEIACRQSAKSWQLRATMSLARLLGKQAKCNEARAMLAEI